MPISLSDSEMSAVIDAAKPLQARQRSEFLREDQPRAQAAQLAFDRSYGAAIGRTGVAAVPGAELALDKLRGSGVRVCLISGFSKKVFASVLDALGSWDKIDLAVSPDETPRAARRWTWC